MNAVGYNLRRFFAAFQYLADIQALRIDKKLGVQMGYGKTKLIFGYRFAGKK